MMCARFVPIEAAYAGKRKTGDSDGFRLFAREARIRRAAHPRLNRRRRRANLSTRILWLIPAQAALYCGASFVNHMFRR